jgi:cytidine deaminase
MPELTSVPRHLLNLQPNLDMITDIPKDLLRMNEGDLGWLNLQWLPLLSNRAETASFQAVSYRNFRVGAALLAFSTDTEKIGIFTGFNVKTHPENAAQINIHAEQMALTKARHWRFNSVGSLAVWGEPQADTQSGLEPPTLHPCGLCRELLAKSPETKGTTPILSANPDFSICEVYGLDDLLLMHGPQIKDGSSANLLIEPEPFSLRPGYLGGGDSEPADNTLLLLWSKLNPNAKWAKPIAEYFSTAETTI